jgi:hypothetical protein
MMLDAAGGSTELPLAIVVGRTLSSYSVPQVTGNQVTITYTVYNQQAAAESGVLLTTTLQPGVTYAQASLPANQIGQELAWSLGTIPGYGRASVSVTVNLGSNGPLQLDSGAQVFATLAGGLIKDHTPAAVLSDHAAPDGWLSATPDANSLNPFIQEEAARLDYDPQRIFDTLHQTIGYNAYAGSTRGALGTLWDGDGNALDVASLGVALMRASGIPATYAQGTLTTAQAQQLIRSMFPATYQNVGYIPNGTDVSDPANDPALLALAAPHYWFQFDAGTGLVNADPLMTATLGQSAASPTGTFTEVADALRSKTRIQVDAEIYSQAGALFGGSGLSTSTVLDLTFNDVSLVGRPLTIGNDVSTTGGGFVFTALSHTYSPYVIVAGDSADPKDDQVVYGTDYQEVLTNFPLGSQILTGVFLHVTLIAPDGTTTTTTKPLADRLGPAIRMNGGSPNLTFNDSTPPLLNSLDLTTIGVSPGGMNSALVNSYQPSLDRLSAELDAFHQKVEANYAGSETLSPSDAAQANALLSRMLIAIARSRLAL